MTNWYYYNKNGDKVGPITSTVLQSLAQQGLIISETLIGTEQGNTVRAGSIRGLEFTNQPKSVLVPPTLPNRNTNPTPITSQQIVGTDEGLMKIGMTPNTYFMLMHLCVVFFPPLIFVLWVLVKDMGDVRVYIHAKIIVNWWLGLLFYTLISCVLCLLIIGIVLLFALSICSIVFPIIAAVKASKGEIWKYPFSLPFFRV